MSRILVVDNYDSFVYTLVGYLRELGADYQETDPMSPNVIVDRSLYTGQNPASSEPLAQRILRDF